MSDNSSQPENDGGNAAAESTVKPVLPKREGPVEQPRPDPTRYGDWEKNGRCIDF